MSRLERNGTWWRAWPMSIPALPIRRPHERAMPALPFHPEARCPMSVQSYLFFEGRPDEAIAFSGKALDAEVLIRITYGYSPAGSGELTCGLNPPSPQL